MPNATSLRIITLVVCAIAIDATIGIGTLSYCLVTQIKPDPTLITAYVGLTSGLAGALTGLLVNTRTTPTQEGVATTTSTTTTTTQPTKPPTEPAEVVVVNPPTEPVPTTESKP